jgi:hypothetical protein
MKNVVILLGVFVLSLVASASVANAACYSEPKYVKTVNTSDWYEITNNCGGDISVHYATRNDTFGTQEWAVTVQACGDTATFAYDPKQLVGNVTIESGPDAVSRLCVAKDARRDDAVSKSGGAPVQGGAKSQQAAAPAQADDEISRRLAAAEGRVAHAKQNDERQRDDFAQEASDADRRFQAVKAEEEADAAAQQAKIDRAVAKCAADHDQAVAVCTGNTNQYRKENFVSSWVNLESSTCLTAAIRDQRLCEAIAKRAPQSTIDRLTQDWAESDSLHKRVEDSYGSYLPQNADDDSTAAPVDQSPTPSYQNPAPQRRVTTALFPQMPAVTVPSPVQPRPGGGFNCPYANQACAVH